MKKRLVKTYLTVSLVLFMSPSLTANTVDAIVGGVIGGIIASVNSNQHKKYRKKHYKKRRKRKKTAAVPAHCSAQKWSSQIINGKTFATNFQGIVVTTEGGQLVVDFDAKVPLPSIFNSGDAVQINTSFNKKKSKMSAAVVLPDKKHLRISGVDAVYVIDLLKRSKYIEVDFINNKYCTQLSGSSKSIRMVEKSLMYASEQGGIVPSAAHALKGTTATVVGGAVATAAFVAPALGNTPVDKARVERAMSEHAHRAERIASNQKEFADKMLGIRPKSDLAKADGNIYDIKIQYYIPGSEETGEMWIDWHIDEEKGPMMRLHFIDPTHKYDIEAHEVDVSLNPIKEPCNTDVDVKADKSTSPSCEIIKDILVAHRWAEIAEREGIRRRYRKRISFVEGNETTKRSVAVYFQTYENGAKTVQIEEMNHGFPKQFNFTIAQALELAKYIENTRKKAHKEWLNKTRTKEELDALFK